MRKILHQTHVLQKTCPHCGEINHLTLIDLIRSYYLRTTYENLSARHWCHHCHKGWDVTWFFWAGLLVLLADGLLLLVVISLVTGLNGKLTDMSQSEIVIILICCFAIAAVDFALRTFAVKLLPLKKQT